MRSTSSPRAVSMMIGTCERLRSSRHSDRPSSPGSIRSSTIRSTCERSRTRRISLPSGTAVVRNSCFSRYCASRPRISRSSSTIRRWGRSWPGNCEDTRQQTWQRFGRRPKAPVRARAVNALASGPEWKRSARSGAVASCASRAASCRSRCRHSCGAPARSRVQLEVPRLGCRAAYSRRAAGSRGASSRSARRARLDQRAHQQQIELAPGSLLRSARAARGVAPGPLRAKAPRACHGAHLLEVPQLLARQRDERRQRRSSG